MKYLLIPYDSHTAPQIIARAVELGANCEIVEENVVRSRTKTKKVAGESFETFWALYPKKKSRAQAEAVWAKLAPDAELVSRIVEAVKAARQTDDWTKSNGQFIPYPATWLNNARWTDELQIGLSKPQPNQWWLQMGYKTKEAFEEAQRKDEEREKAKDRERHTGVYRPVRL